MDSTWTPSTEHPGFMCKTIQHGNATIVMRRPILSQEERDKRMKAIEKAAADLIIDRENKRREKYREHHRN